MCSFASETRYGKKKRNKKQVVCICRTSMIQTN